MRLKPPTLQKKLASSVTFSVATKYDFFLLILIVYYPFLNPGVWLLYFNFFKTNVFSWARVSAEDTFILEIKACQCLCTRQQILSCLAEPRGFWLFFCHTSMLTAESLADVSPPDPFIQIQLHSLELFAFLIFVVCFFFLSWWVPLSFSCCVHNSHEYTLNLMEHWKLIWAPKVP